MMPEYTTGGIDRQMGPPDPWRALAEAAALLAAGGAFIFLLTSVLLSL